MAPLLVFSHGCEFLCARLDQSADGCAVHLRITADYGGNPMLTYVAAARSALQEVLRVEHGGISSRLADLAPLQIEPATQWDDAMPATVTPPPDGQTHQLLVARWTWRPDVSEIRFSVAKDSVHDVLLWRERSDGESQSMLLIAGDQSAAISVRQSHLSAWITGSVIAVLIWWLVRRSAFMPSKASS